MSTDDKDRLRKVSFREFADEWLDKLNPEYDGIGDIWVAIFREEIVSYLNTIREKTEALIRLIEATGAEEAYEAFAAEFGGEEGPRLPAYEMLLPVIRTLGGRDDDSALAVMGIFEYARARRLSVEDGAGARSIGSIERSNRSRGPLHP
jgi:hypothetical protein